MVRIVTRSQPIVLEDWGIVSVHPLPELELDFDDMATFIREFLVDHRHIPIRDVQRSHLGQALVRFRNFYDRDNLISLGPQQAMDFTLTTIRHNEAWTIVL